MAFVVRARPTGQHAAMRGVMDGATIGMAARIPETTCSALLVASRMAIAWIWGSAAETAIARARSRRPAHLINAMLPGLRACNPALPIPIAREALSARQAMRPPPCACLLPPASTSTIARLRSFAMSARIRACRRRASFPNPLIALAAPAGLVTTALREASTCRRSWRSFGLVVGGDAERTASKILVSAVSAFMVMYS